MGQGHRQRESRAVMEAAAAIEWLAASIPEVACSVATSDAHFQSPDAFWSKPANLETCLAYQDRFASGMDDKIRAAHLVAFYSHQLSLAAGAIYLVSGLVPVVAGLRFETYLRARDGRSLVAGRFHFLVDLPRSESEIEPDEPTRRFHDAFVAHLKPVIALLKRRCGLSARAQWRLAADSLAGAFLEIGRRRQREDRATGQALAIVKRAHSPLVSRQLHYEKIEAASGSGGELRSRTYRIRGGCCLFYRAEGGSFCDTCVLLEPELRREMLRAHLLDSK
ncbi:ferric iron reductase [Sinorhizobium sp. CCBAU 05631]|uniref:ferric iron reductase n=2 Tax=Sinorhizobium sp. CCBAU 05631 TaxID=794846 RepID=UPI001FDA7F83|nr:ferric iron reductase [Sinorhizobium sp. CCBAU 05631]